MRRMMTCVSIKVSFLALWGRGCVQDCRLQHCECYAILTLYQTYIKVIPSLLTVNNNGAVTVTEEGQTHALKSDEGTPNELCQTVEDVIKLVRELPKVPTREQARKVLWTLPCLRFRDPQNEESASTEQNASSQKNYGASIL